jgi:hypothetical protein
MDQGHHEVASQLLRLHAQQVATFRLLATEVAASFFFGLSMWMRDPHWLPSRHLTHLTHAPGKPVAALWFATAGTWDHFFCASVLAHAAPLWLTLASYHLHI